VRTDDFPRVIEDRQRKLDKYDKMKKLLKVKDDIIWNLIAEKRSIFEKNVHDIEEKYRNEAAEMFKYIFLLILDSYSFMKLN
jgi:hypothetical protein